MSFVPGFTYDLFFSYASVDDEPRMPGDEKTRWISLFRECLTLSINRKLGRAGSVDDFYDCKDLRSNSPLTHSLEESLDASAIFVAVNSGSYLHPDCACNLERTHFLRLLGATDDQRRDQRRIWIAHIDDVPRADWQTAFFPDVRGCEFYFRDTRTDAVRLLPRLDNPQPFLDKIDDLATEIADRLKEMKKDADPTFRSKQPTVRSGGPPVFLAETFGDPSGERRQLRKVLQEAGYTVLPTREYDPATYLEDVRADIDSCIAFVQLLGLDPWKFGGYDVLQHRAALDSKKPAFRWRSPDIVLPTVEPETHRAFLSTDDVTASAMEDFQRKLLVRLEQLSMPASAPRPGGAVNGVLVRYAVRPEDSQLLGPHVQQLLTQKGVCFEELTLAETFTPRYMKEPCQGFILLCGAVSHGTVLEEELRERISECRRIQLAVKEEKRMPALGIFYWPPPEDVHLRSSAYKMHKIRSDRDAELSAFFKEVFAVAA